MRTNITKSKAGHYTVTIREPGRILFQENRIGSLIRARVVLQEQKAKIEQAKNGVVS